MTIAEWRDYPDYAIKLQEMIKSPVFQAALSVLENNTLAKTLGNASALERFADKANVFFGYDSGRNSVITDLKFLAESPEETKEIHPSYQNYQE
jgi:hypothetical protein